MTLHTEKAYCYKEKNTGLWLAASKSEDGLDVTLESEFHPDYLYFNLDYYKEIVKDYVNLDNFDLAEIDIVYHSSYEEPKASRKQLLQDIYG